MKEGNNMFLGAGLIISGVLGFGYSVMQVVNIASTLLH